MMEFWLIILFLLLSAYFSGSETVFLSVNRIRLEGFLHTRRLGSKSAIWFLRRPSRFILTTLVGNNLANIAFSSILTAYLIRRGIPTGWSLPVGASLILLFGEVIPKSFARDMADPASLWISPPLRIFRFFLYPLNKTYGWISRQLLALLGFQRSEVQEFFTKRDLEVLIREGAKTGVLRSHQESHISRILRFRSLRARDVMTPRTEIIALDSSSAVEDLFRTAQSSGLSKIPIYEEDIDHIIGVAYARDLFEEPDKLADIAKPIAFFPEQTKAWMIFRELRAVCQTIAIIIDEWGGTEGLVTIEDLIEELTGEIEDEYDPARFSVQHLGEERWLVSARMEVDELNHRLRLDLPEGDYETLGGYLIHVLERIPEKGEKITLGSYRFEIIKATRTRIRIVMMERIEPEKYD
jgi:CBS domain containing-hemolysin-like protein